MTADKETAKALASAFTDAQIRDYRLTALKVKMEGGTITRNYEGSSFTISLENCSQIIADTNEALDILETQAVGDDPDVTGAPICAGFDFSWRQTR